MPFLHLNALSEHLVALSGAQSADFTALGGNVGPEIENISGLGGNICIKTCIMWNKKRGGERDHEKVAPKVSLSLQVASISGMNFGCFFDNPEKKIN